MIRSLRYISPYFLYVLAYLVAILKFVREHPVSSSVSIHQAAGKGSFATTKREINALVKSGQLVVEGHAVESQGRTSLYYGEPSLCYPFIHCTHGRCA